MPTRAFAVLRSSLLLGLATSALACDPGPPSEAPDSSASESMPEVAPANGAAPAMPESPDDALASADPQRAALLPELERYVAAVADGFDGIDPERREALDKLAAFVRTHVDEDQDAAMTFICTHNSRRSQMGQVWAAVAASYYGIDSVRTYSGGTESTAFNPRAVAALERAGFDIEPGTEAKLDETPNPRHRVTYSEDREPLEAFSKTFDDDANPKQDFAAVMTCSAADAACPFVPGAALRISNAYEDPKAADGTPEEQARYDERCRQIATEMFYLMARAAA